MVWINTEAERFGKACRLTLSHAMACMVCSAIAQAIHFFDWVRLVDHGLGNRWLLGNHGRLVNFGLIVLLAAFDGGRVVSCGFQDCALVDVCV